MNGEVAKTIVTMVCDDYIDLKFNDILVDKFIDKICIEFANFISEGKNYE